MRLSFLGLHRAEKTDSMAPMPKPPKKSASKGGRPAKFDEPSRPVTITLPDRILDRLKEIDADRALAIVKAVEVGVLPRSEKKAHRVIDERFE